MRAIVASALLFMPAFPAGAHRLDEYLQATRIAVATNRITVSIDLTPGVAIVGQLLPVIDSNRDGRVSDEEGNAYARRVLKDIRVDLDGKSMVLGLVDFSFPPLADVRAGLGVIRIKAATSIDHLTTGRHELDLLNTHLAAISVYLVNVLVPKDRLIRITRQTRNEIQQIYRLDFTLNPTSPRGSPFQFQPPPSAL